MLQPQARGRRAGASILTKKKARDPVGTVKTRTGFANGVTDEDDDLELRYGNPSAVAVCADGVLVANQDMIFRAVIDDEQRTQSHLVTRVDYTVISMKDDPRGRGFFVLSAAVGGGLFEGEALRLLDYEGRELLECPRYFDRRYLHGRRQSPFVNVRDIAPSLHNYVYFSCNAGVVELRPVYRGHPGFEGIPNSGRSGFSGYSFPVDMPSPNQGGPYDTTLRRLMDPPRPWIASGLALTESEGTLIVSATNDEDAMYAVMVVGLASQQILSQHYYYASHNPGWIGSKVVVGSSGIVYLACCWYVLRYTGGNNSMLEDTLAGGYDGIDDDDDDGGDVWGTVDGQGTSASFERITGLALDEKRGLLWVADKDVLRTVAVPSLSEQRAETLYSMIRLVVLYQRRRAVLLPVDGSALLDRVLRLPECLIGQVLSFARLWKQNAFEHELVTNMLYKCEPFSPRANVELYSPRAL